jgi:hypothetical protein
MERKHLIGALEYTEKLLSLGEKTVFDVQANSIACFLESDFVGNEGVSLNIDNGDVWLRMKRLRETNAPKHHSMFDGWYTEAFDLTRPRRARRLLRGLCALGGSNRGDPEIRNDGQVAVGLSDPVALCFDRESPGRDHDAYRVRIWVHAGQPK